MLLIQYIRLVKHIIKQLSWIFSFHLTSFERTADFHRLLLLSSFIWVYNQSIYANDHLLTQRQFLSFSCVRYPRFSSSQLVYYILTCICTHVYTYSMEFKVLFISLYSIIVIKCHIKISDRYVLNRWRMSNNNNLASIEYYFNVIMFNARIQLKVYIHTYM